MQTSRSAGLFHGVVNYRLLLCLNVLIQYANTNAHINTLLRGKLKSTGKQIGKYQALPTFHTAYNARLGGGVRTRLNT